MKPDLSDVEPGRRCSAAEVRPDEVPEDSIERGELRQTIMEMADAIKKATAEDVANGTSAPSTVFLATMDGIPGMTSNAAIGAAGTRRSREGPAPRHAEDAARASTCATRRRCASRSSVGADSAYRNIAGRLRARTVAGDPLALEDDTPGALLRACRCSSIPLFLEYLGVGGDQTAIVAVQARRTSHAGIWRNIRFESDYATSPEEHAEDRRNCPLRREVRRGAGVAKAINVQLPGCEEHESMTDTPLVSPPAP